jgi:thiamine biosynthesis lipoprotein
MVPPPSHAHRLWDWFRGRGRDAVRPWIAHYERVLGTSLEIQVVASEVVARQAEAAALTEIERLEAVFSCYSPTSELRRWQETRAIPVRLSPELLQVLQASERWRVATRNAFHPATEVLTQRWKRAAEAGCEPSDAELVALVAGLDEPVWQLAGAEGTATRLQDVPVNLNAIAKGFIVDRACERAAAEPGVRQVLLNLGGDLRVLGPNGVVVGIADPARDAENVAPLLRVRVTNGAVATSGGYRRGVRVGERWHSHLLDARTGQPVEHVASASVVAATAMEADVLATACSVLHPDESLALVDSLPGVACLLVTPDGQVRRSTGWAHYELIDFVAGE